MNRQLGLPDPLSTEPRTLDVLVDQLRFRELDTTPAPFAAPTDILEVAARLGWWRISGAASDGPDLLPVSLVSGRHACGRPLGFRLVRSGGQVLVAVGTHTEDAPMFASATAAAVGAPTVAACGPPSRWRSWGCLHGPLGRLDPYSTSPLDLLFDADEEPFEIVIVATPCPDDAVEQDLTRLDAAVERLSRLGSPGSRDPRITRALRALEAWRTRLEEARARGVWRASILVGAGDPGGVMARLGALAGALAPPPGAFLPLRARACAGSNDGWSVHANLLPCEELAAACMLPRFDRAGFTRTRYARFDVEPPVGGSLSLGSIVEGRRVSSHRLTVELSSLSRHVLIVGQTGSGKSTTVRHLLHGLLAANIPFLVLDPVKPCEDEYAALLGASPGVLLLRAGAAPAAGEIPLLLNPFAFPLGFALATHIDLIKTTFVHALGLFPPTPFLLERALYRVYEEVGWDLATGTHPHPADPFSFPTLTDLVDVVGAVVDEAGYGAEITMNLRGALQTRLSNLCFGPKGALLDTREQIPDSVLFERPAIIELRHLGAQDEQALIMGFLLVRLWEHRQVSGLPPTDDLRHLVVVEEAHRLLKNSRKPGAEDADMAYQAVEMFVSLMAESRAYGQGFAIIEQLPSTLAPGAVKHPVLRLAHRLTASEDRSIVARAMLLEPDQEHALGTLDRGEMIAWSEGMDAPLRIRVPRARSAVRPTHLVARTRSALGPGIVPLERALARRAAGAVINHPEVAQAADGLVARAHETVVVADDLEVLRSRIRQVRMARAQKTPSAEMEGQVKLALLDALLRRFRFERTDSTAHSRAAEGLDRDIVGYLRTLAGRKARMAGPYAFCVRCSDPCRSGFEGRRLGEAPEVRHALDLALGDPKADVGLAVRRALQDAAHRVLPGLTTLRPLVHACAAGFLARAARLAPAEAEWLRRTTLGSP